MALSLLLYTTIIFSPLFPLHAVSPIPVPRHAHEVITFFKDLETKKAHIPNILEISPDEFDLRIAQMSSSVERIISLLKYHPNKKSYALIKRFFKMYAIVAGKQLDFTSLKKNDPRLLKQHEIRFLRKQINLFTDDMEKALMFVARNDDLSLQMGYDMMIVNTYFKQLFAPAAFPRAPWYQEYAFDLKHSPHVQKQLIGSLAIIGLGTASYIAYKALKKEKVLHRQTGEELATTQSSLDKTHKNLQSEETKHNLTRHQLSLEQQKEINKEKKINKSYKYI